MNRILCLLALVAVCSAQLSPVCQSSLEKLNPSVEGSVRSLQESNYEQAYYHLLDAADSFQDVPQECYGNGEPVPPTHNEGIPYLVNRTACIDDVNEMESILIDATDGLAQFDIPRVIADGQELFAVVQEASTVCDTTFTLAEVVKYIEGQLNPDCAQVTTSIVEDFQDMFRMLDGGFSGDYHWNIDLAELVPDYSLADTVCPTGPTYFDIIFPEETTEEISEEREDSGVSSSPPSEPTAALFYDDLIRFVQNCENLDLIHTLNGEGETDGGLNTIGYYVEIGVIILQVIQLTEEFNQVGAAAIQEYIDTKLTFRQKQCIDSAEDLLTEGQVLVEDIYHREGFVTFLEDLTFAFLRYEEAKTLCNGLLPVPTL